MNGTRFYADSNCVCVCYFKYMFADMPAGKRNIFICYFYIFFSAAFSLVRSDRDYYRILNSSMMNARVRAAGKKKKNIFSSCHFWRTVLVVVVVYGSKCVVGRDTAIKTETSNDIWFLECAHK